MILSLLLLAAQAATPPAPPPAQPPMAMQRADTNRDGTVTRAEAVAGADAMFARMDADRDGRVTREERRAAATALRTERRGPRPMADGTLTLAESRTRAGERFDRIDANRDGRLDPAELAAMPRRGPHGRHGPHAPPPPAPADAD